MIDSIVINNPDPIILQTTSSNISCFGLQDGVVSINVSSVGPNHLTIHLTMELISKYQIHFLMWMLETIIL